MTYTPLATYRLQLSPKFGFNKVKQLLPYLHDLGISTLYAAPFFKAVPGSEHGYDVTDPLQLNPEIGTQQEFETIAAELQNYKMGWLQDIVPNHMAYHLTNTWLMDVMEKGPDSKFYSFFDINFEHPDFEGKLMVPFLGEQPETVLKQKDLKITFGEQGFQITYFDNKYPASTNSYSYLTQKLGSITGDAEKGLLQTINFNKAGFTNWDKTKNQLYETINSSPNLKSDLKKLLQTINTDPVQLKELLELQYYQLCFWQDAQARINFRRFFTVNDLICLRMELPEVFSKYHQYINQLSKSGLVQGLRVDHVDGLLDPDGYLKQLRHMAGGKAYIIVEKILEGDEHLPDYWPIQGNSGYDFLAWVCNLFTAPDGKEQLTQIYQRIVPAATTDYNKLVFDKKLFILEKRMQGELQNLLRLLKELLHIPAPDEQNWYKALVVLLASFPVYRVYGNSFPLPDMAQQIIEKAFATALKHAPEQQAKLTQLKKIYLPDLDEPDSLLEAKLYFVMRSQQFTGPLAAKGVEDTAFYNYNRLISLNEVGNSPDIFHLEPEGFHERMQRRQQHFNLSLNATATHDTKRGEDARIRINVLSELPEIWEEKVQQWIKLAHEVAPGTIPRNNDLYFIFQALLGVMPFDETIDNNLIERVQEYITKALRETKARTNWTNPNEEYEEATRELASKLLQNKTFTNSFLPFFRKVAHYGWLYSLNQLLLKLTCPGIPDIYQGTELWDLSLVDPDNRRDVDYSLRQQYLKELKQLDKEDTDSLHKQLLMGPESGKVKLYLLYKTLATRHNYSALFTKGNYTALQVTGKYKDKIVAFSRRLKDQWCIVVVPRLLVTLLPQQGLPLGENTWGDTEIMLPAEAPQQWRHEFRKKQLKVNGTAAVAQLLDTMPVALLIAI